MAKSRSSIKGESEPRTEAPSEDVKPDPEPAQDNKPKVSARASSLPAKKPAAVKFTQELPDRSPEVTIQHFARGTRDPILRAFAAHEKLTHGTRKLTHAGWKAEFVAFKKVGR